MQCRLWILKAMSLSLAESCAQCSTGKWRWFLWFSSNRISEHTSSDGAERRLGEVINKLLLFLHQLALRASLACSRHDNSKFAATPKLSRLTHKMIIYILHILYIQVIKEQLLHYIHLLFSSAPFQMMMLLLPLESDTHTAGNQSGKRCKGDAYKIHATWHTVILHTDTDDQSIDQSINLTIFLSVYIDIYRQIVKDTHVYRLKIYMVKCS